MEIELNAKQLSEKLEQVQNEKRQLEDEFSDNQHAIDKYNHEIASMKAELDNMKSVIAHTFEEELQTANSMATSKKKKH